MSKSASDKRHPAMAPQDKLLHLLELLEADGNLHPLTRVAIREMIGGADPDKTPAEEPK